MKSYFKIVSQNSFSYNYSVSRYFIDTRNACDEGCMFFLRTHIQVHDAKYESQNGFFTGLF